MAAVRRGDGEADGEHVRPGRIGHHLLPGVLIGFHSLSFLWFHRVFSLDVLLIAVRGRVEQVFVTNT